jgi:hypothetical protein
MEVETERRGDNNFIEETQGHVGKNGPDIAP